MILVTKWQKSQLDGVVCKADLVSYELGHLAEIPSSV